MFGAEEVADTFGLVVPSNFTRHQDIRITTKNEAVFGQESE